VHSFGRMLARAAGGMRSRRSTSCWGAELIDQVRSPPAAGVRLHHPLDCAVGLRINRLKSDRAQLATGAWPTRAKSVDPGSVEAPRGG